MYKDLKEMNVKNEIDRIVAGLMKKYGASHDQAVEATHQAFANMQGKEYNPKARLHYWFTAARNEYFKAVKKQSKHTSLEDLQEHHITTVEQPDKERSRILDSLMYRLDKDEWILLEMVRYGLPNDLIAESHGWKDSTLRARKSELLKKIKTIIQHNF